MAKLQNGGQLPNIIKFDPNAVAITVFTPLPKDEKVYLITVSGTTKYYNPISSVTAQYSITVRCIPNSITP